MQKGYTSKPLMNVMSVSYVCAIVFVTQCYVLLSFIDVCGLIVLDYKNRVFLRLEIVVLWVTTWTLFICVVIMFVFFINLDT